MNNSTSLWKQANFLKLWYSQVFNLIAQIVLDVVLISHVYRLTNSIFGATLVPAVTSISIFMGSLLASYYINKFDLQKLLHGIGWIRAVIMILLIFVTISTISPMTFIIYILLFKFGLSFVGSWYTPARFALLPLVVSSEQYVKANGTITMIQQVIMTAGWGLGSASLLIFSKVQLLILCCLMFAVSGLLIQSIKKDEKEGSLKAKERAKPGWKIAIQSPIIRSITFMDVIEGLANAIWSAALLLGFTTVVLNKTEEWWGFINAGYFIGAIVGSLLVVISSKILEKKLITMIALSSILMGILTFFFSIFTFPMISVVLCILMGPMYQIRDIAQSTILQDVIPKDQIARVMAARNIILSPWNGLAIIIMGFLSDIIGVKNVFFLASLLYLFTAFLVMLQPELRNYSYRSKDIHSL